jgi:hypothetical protein
MIALPLEERIFVSNIEEKRDGVNGVYPVF